ncbi:MAG: DegT/DnrJ/EryC1/StrS family aminotransferase, partial [Deltaproteobacteria bacterium]|nr:DegT/DnrJ/EryC1/StrS family aminotransferase [Deltaproteobacteria bacterium]
KDATINGFYDNNRDYVDKLEYIIKQVTHSGYCFATPCCTSAMYSSCLALDLKEGDEVICTDLSWASTSFVIDYVKAMPVFVDVDFETWCIDPIAIENAITKKTKAIMIVHMFGHPCNMDEIMRIANKYNLDIIEDAAPALGATYKGRAVGTFGNFGCFSFHGAKLVVSGQGGVFITNDKKLFDKAALLSSTGRTDSKGTFWCDVVGHHHEISNICAAMAYAQISRLEELIGIKHTIFSWYEERLRDIEGIKLLRQQKDCFSTYCYPGIFLEDSIVVSREYILEELQKVNIHGRPVFPRMSRFPMHEERFENPVASIVEKRGMNLPSAANITEEDVDFVCKSLINIIGR